MELKKYNIIQFWTSPGVVFLRNKGKHRAEATIFIFRFFGSIMWYWSCEKKCARKGFVIRTKHSKSDTNSKSIGSVVDDPTRSYLDIIRPCLDPTCAHPWSYS